MRGASLTPQRLCLGNRAYSSRRVNPFRRESAWVAQTWRGLPLPLIEDLITEPDRVRQKRRG